MPAGILDANPARSAICGSQPKCSRARVISGWRWRGSSWGKGAWTSGEREPVSSRTASASSIIVNSPGLPMFTGPVRSSGYHRRPGPRLASFRSNADSGPGREAGTQARDGMAGFTIGPRVTAALPSMALASGFPAGMTGRFGAGKTGVGPTSPTALSSAAASSTVSSAWAMPWIPM